MYKNKIDEISIGVEVGWRDYFEQFLDGRGEKKRGMAEINSNTVFA